MGSGRRFEAAGTDTGPVSVQRNGCTRVRVSVLSAASVSYRETDTARDKPGSPEKPESPTSTNHSTMLED